MGAEDEQGCSAELESDGKVDSWEFGEIPEPSEPQPMTCEWIESNNCWKQMVGRIRSCVPQDEAAQFSEDRTMCLYDSGEMIEWDGSVNEPDPGETHVPIIQHRFIDADGEPCFTAKWQGVAHVAYDVGGDVGVLRADSLTSFTLICPDGTTYTSDAEGSCPELGARWLASELPGYDTVCDGDDGRCEFIANGAPGGKQTVAACEF